MIINLFCFASSSMSTTERTVTDPCPVRYAFKIPERPQIMPPVGKSGAGISSKMRSSERFGLFNNSIEASSTSLILAQTQ